MSTTSARQLPGISLASPKSGSSNKRKKMKAKQRRQRKAQTNKFMTAINVGQTVRLTKSRIAFVKYKGKVKFGIGTWYGVELYDSITKTRHNGTVFGKRYFNCPRNKGLFVQRQQIMEVIPPQNIKKVLKELEKKQIKQRKAEAKRKKAEIAAKNKAAAIKHANHAKNGRSMLAMYQQQVYGNNKLVLQLEKADNSNEVEKKIKKDFKRFQRLSMMAMNNDAIAKMIKEDNKLQFVDYQSKDNENEDDNESKEKEEDGQDIDANDKQSEREKGEKSQSGSKPLFSGKDPHEGIDIDTEAWDSYKEKPILELVDDGSNDPESNENSFNVRLFYPLKDYITEYEYVFNKGLLVKEVDTISKQGRNLILECGVQGDKGWYIDEINGDNIRKFSKEKLDDVLDKLLPDIGYDITLKQA